MPRRVHVDVIEGISKPGFAVAALARTRTFPVPARTLASSATVSKWPLVLVLVGASLVAGCNSESTEPGGHASAHSTHAGEDTAHDGHGAHGPVGPNGGHVIALGEGEFHAEWLHDDDSSTITVFILDREQKAEVAIPASEIEIEIVVNDTQEAYRLKAVHPTDQLSGEASQFELQSEALLVALNVGEGVTATMKVEVDGQLRTGQIEHVEHDDHGHHHH